jgi:hypothetical protein
MIIGFNLHDRRNKIVRLAMTLRCNRSIQGVKFYEKGGTQLPVCEECSLLL